jgi:hypothetical protein
MPSRRPHPVGADPLLIIGNHDPHSRGTKPRSFSGAVLSSTGDQEARQRSTDGWH